MSKKKYNSWIKELSRVFSDDEECLLLLAGLKQKVGSKTFVKNKTSGSGEFPLPDEVIANHPAIGLFSDGACRGNPGPGSWGVIGQDDSGEVFFKASGVEIRTTNNIMELEAAIQGLKVLKENHPEAIKKNIFLYSDSKYVVEGMKSWVAGWKKRGWKKADRKPPETLQQWKNLDELAQKFMNLSFVWIKGHAGHPQNEYVDQLANEALDESGF